MHTHYGDLVAALVRNVSQFAIIRLGEGERCSERAADTDTDR